MGINMTKHLRVPQEAFEFCQQQAQGTGESWSTIARALLAKAVRLEKQHIKEQTVHIAQTFTSTN